MKNVVKESIKALGLSLDDILGAPNSTTRSNGLVDVFKVAKSLSLEGEKLVTSAAFSGIAGLTVTLKADDQLHQVGANCLYRAILETGKSPLVNYAMSSEFKGKMKQAQKKQIKDMAKRAERATVKE